MQFPQCDGLLLKSEQAPEQHAGDTPVQGAAVQEPHLFTLLLRLVHVPLQQAGWATEHYQGKSDFADLWLSRLGMFTVLAQEPQFALFPLKSTQAPEQHPGSVPLQGVAIQEPQWFKSELVFVHDPEQQLGAEELHYIEVSVLAGLYKDRKKVNLQLYCMLHNLKYY